MAPSPVKHRAVSAGLEVLQPERARDPGLHARLAEIAPEVCVVVAFGRILPAALLEVPRLGFVNLHFSVLPAYRGAAPVQHAIADGLTETGVSLIVLSPGMDEGPILATKREPIGAGDTAGTLGARLAERGSRLLVPVLEGYAAGEILPVEQNHDAATYAPKITTEEARIDWARPAGRIRDLVRALNPDPGAWTTLRDTRLKVHAVTVAERPADLAPGELRAEELLSAGTGSEPVTLDDVQLAGKRRMTGVELARGLRLAPGERLL
jgi:methionyl-tRNA formyltransferase